jgi:hypothetical protein
VTDASLLAGPPPAFDGSLEPAPLTLQSIMASRRSIRRLQPGPFTAATRERLLDAIQHTPAAYNLPPWRIVLVHERRDALWAEIAQGFRETLADDRLDRYLDRLHGFASGIAVALIFEDRTVARALKEDRGASSEIAGAFVQQALGMVQLALWLAVTAEGLVASLQHWDHLVGPRLARFAGLPETEHALAAVMPIGYAAEEPRVDDRADRNRLAAVDTPLRAPEQV